MTQEEAETAGVTLWFTSFGLRIGVQAADPGVLAHLAARPPAAWRPTGQGRADRVYSLAWDSELGCHVLSVGPLTIDRSGNLDHVLAAVEVDARHFVAEFARARVFVHAGTVRIDGRAVVIPGRSGTGKSTLVAALVRRGATYYSDEYAVFDERGRVHAYPKPVSLRAEDGSSEEVDLDPATKGRRLAVPLGAVLSGHFAGSGTRWQPTSESTGRGMMALLDNTIAVRRQPEKTLAFLQPALIGAIVLAGPRGEADVTADAVMRRLEAEWA